ncbi:MAG TPA: trypsin-like peptidase domain-containing protein [Bryobacteraceae bacterium]|nr:trypsin-like peptidase domain-containing protein [Bryobacteraceae bacterium]
MPVPLSVPGRVAEALRRSTVQVRGARGGSGSAVVLNHRNLITNAHVIGGEAIHVESWEGKVHPANIVRLDRGRDLALLHAPDLDAPSAALGDSDRLQAGAPIIAVGNPFGFIGAVSTGVVHAVGSLAGLGGREWVQADLRLAPGNSGGPLADWQGNVVGINTMIVSGGLALAIPSRLVQAFLTRAKSRRSLGLMLRPIHMKAGGVGLMILEIVVGGAAEAASLLPGDILLGANGRRFRDTDDLQIEIDRPGPLLRLDFQRGGQPNLRHVSVRYEEAVSAA